MYFNYNSLEYKFHIEYLQNHDTRKVMTLYLKIKYMYRKKKYFFIYLAFVFK